MTRPVPNNGQKSWDEFVEALANIARVPVGDIGNRTALLEDLGLDSLALTELVVMLIVDFEMGALSDELDERNWSGVTAGQLYDEYRHGPRALRPGDRVIFHPDR